MSASCVLQLGRGRDTVFLALDASWSKLLDAPGCLESFTAPSRGGFLFAGQSRPLPVVQLRRLGCPAHDRVTRRLCAWPASLPSPADLKLGLLRLQGSTDWRAARTVLRDLEVHAMSFKKAAVACPPKDPHLAPRLVR